MNQRKLHVFIADDDLDDIDFFRAVVKDISEQIRVSVASDCMELLEFIQITKPDIIFLDLNMPYKDGLICLREIRAMSQFSDIPIIIYSNSTNPQHIEETYTYGANLYLEKPVNYLMVRQQLKELLSLPSKMILSRIPKEEYFIAAES